MGAILARGEVLFQYRDIDDTASVSAVADLPLVVQVCKRHALFLYADHA
jgi:hypothetical protein